MTPQEQEWRDTLKSCVCMTDDFNINKIDKAIRPLVLRLREAGFQTVGSCEGGKLCCSGRPYVSMLPDLGSTPTATFERLDKWLVKQGVRDYELSLRIGRGRGSSCFHGIPFITINLPKRDLPPFHTGEFSHEH